MTQFPEKYLPNAQDLKNDYDDYAASERPRNEMERRDNERAHGNEKQREDPRKQHPTEEQRPRKNIPTSTDVEQ